MPCIKIRPCIWFQFSKDKTKAKRTDAGTSSRESHPGMVLMPLPHLRATLLTLKLMLGRSIIIPIYVSSPASCHACFTTLFYRSSPFGKSWRTCSSALHKTNVSVLLLYCTAVILRAFFVKVKHICYADVLCGLLLTSRNTLL